jgi:7-cyano-7-deazaguanine tRNA-ribosyltransferase
MRVFEVRSLDLAARIGRLRTRSGVVQTPTVFPVVHPFRQEVPLDEIRRCGFEAVMTNSYIMYRHAKDRPLAPVHQTLGFSGPIATDSGGYQALEYGEVEADPATMVKVQEELGSDIAVILDLPTRASWSRKKAEESVSRTLQAAEITAQTRSREDILWMGTIQGGRYLELVEFCTERLLQLGFPLLALGGPVEVMEEYDFETLASMILAAKRRMPHSIPLHLFGAGHPLTIPLACALGCDTFDSASYIIYARGNRYLTGNGTARLEQLTTLPCNCRVCSSYTVRDLLQTEQAERTRLLAIHNLSILGQTIAEVRQAIQEGRLWELLANKARNHPRLWNAFRRIAAASGYFEPGTPVRKPRAIFFSSTPDHRRPEVIRHHTRLTNDYTTDSNRLVIIPMPEETTFARSKWPRELARRELKPPHYAVFLFSRAMGLIPIEICEIYPLSQHVASKDQTLLKAAISRARRWISKQHFTELLVLTDAESREEMQRLARAIKGKLLEI